MFLQKDWDLDTHKLLGEVTATALTRVLKTPNPTGMTDYSLFPGAKLHTRSSLESL